MSQSGNIRLETKSNLFSKCLEPLTTYTGEVPEEDTVVFDTTAVVDMLKPSTPRTFDEYAHIVFCPYVRKQLETVQRVDIV